MENPFQVLSEVVRVLEQQGVTYVLVGSMASSMHGMYRSTADIDFLADIKPECAGIEQGTKHQSISGPMCWEFWRHKVTI